MPGLWRAARQRFTAEMRGRAGYWLLSPVTFSLWKDLSEILPRHVKGSVLDAGCGLQSYRWVLEKHATSYFAVDKWVEVPAPDARLDLQDLHGLEDRTFDTVFCSQVLEYVQEPGQALRECFRVLKPGGTLVLSAPFLLGIHDAPQDLFRFSPFGLRSLAERAGFAVLETRGSGGLFSFLGHYFSVPLVMTTWPVPGLRQLAWLLNTLVVRLLVALDSLARTPCLFPVSAVIVATRPH
jgi:SAM-dependent methyltransferase